MTLLEMICENEAAVVQLLVLDIVSEVCQGGDLEILNLVH